MIVLLERAAARSPTVPAVVTSAGPVSYAQLLADARAVAGALRTRGITRPAIVEADAAEILRLLAGAALAGVEACQYQADIAAAEFASQAPAGGHDAVITARADLGPALAPAALRDEPFEAAAPTEQPVLIRTTGTTGAPKSVRHDWVQLGTPLEARVRPRPGQRWLLAYGPHQFAGVQVLLHVLACEGTLIAPFPRQPADGVAALLGCGIDCVSATPTYWRFLIAEARSRGAVLPPLEQVTLGGEAGSADLLQTLRTAFPGARISQIYASTEFGSVVSVRDGLPGFSADALWSEATNAESNLRVTDGELWIRARDQWQPTGDLVEVTGSRVVFVGRTSEVINVGGVKVHPLPVESRITALDGVAMARVYGRPNRLTGAIVAADVVPVQGLSAEDLDAIRDAIREAVAELPRAWHPRSVTFVGELETHATKTIRGSRT